MPRVAIVGIGNVLMGDDALGPHVVKLLDAGYAFSDDVELVEAGTPGVDLAHLLDGRDAVVVVDTVQLRAEPGTVRVLDKAQLLAKNPILPMSPHEPGLREALFLLEFRGGAPADVRLVGVVPADSHTLEVGLSPAVRAAIPAALAETLGNSPRSASRPRAAIRHARPTSGGSGSGSRPSPKAGASSSAAWCRAWDFGRSSTASRASAASAGGCGTTRAA